MCSPGASNGSTPGVSGTSDTLAETKVPEPVKLPSLGDSGELVVPRPRLPLLLGLALLAALVAAVILFAMEGGEEPETQAMMPAATEENAGKSGEPDEAPLLPLEIAVKTEPVADTQLSEIESETLPSAATGDPVPDSEITVWEPSVDENPEAGEATSEEAEDDTTEVSERRRERSRRRQPPPEPEPALPPEDVTPEEPLEQPEETQPPEQEDRTIRETLQHI